LAAEIYGLNILASNIENDGNNTTRFLIMGKVKQMPKDDGSKFITSLVFKVKNIPAALYKTLGGFATNGVNITKLESYVIGGNFVSAQFYVEIEAHPESREFKLALEELKFYSESVHFLGTYKAHPRRYL
jgi:prephenate dehydratase